MLNARAVVGALCALTFSLSFAACGASSPPLTAAGVAGTTGGGSSGTTGAGGSAFDAGPAPDAAAGTGGGAFDASTSDTADAKPFVVSAVAACSKDGWCWSTPAPQGNPLYAISGSGASDVWAVGEAGTIVHYDGSLWTQIPSGESRILRGVWAANARDAWAVGEYDTILRWDGASWSRVAGVPVTGYHWFAVWGTSPNDLWIGGSDAGAGGVMLHWDGAGLKPFLVNQTVTAIGGTGGGDVWALGADHGLIHWDGTTLWNLPSGDLTQIGTDVWGASPSDVWFSGRSAARPSHWDGDGVDASIDQSADINGLWGSGPKDVWAVGDGDPDLVDRGVILHWDGLSWKRTPSPGASRLYDVWGSRADDVWAVGESGDIIHWDGRTWSSPAGPPHLNLFTLWSSGPDDVWAFGVDRTGLGALRWDGRTWTTAKILSYAGISASGAGSAAPYAAWGSGPDDIWVGGVTNEPTSDPNITASRSFFVHWNGSTWSLLAKLPAGLEETFQVADMWGTGPKDVWAIGTAWPAGEGVALRWDGGRWSRVSIPMAFASPFRQLWGSGPNDVWIGADGALLRWDGTSWTKVLENVAGGGFVIAGSGPGDVWAATQLGNGTVRVFHRGGGSYDVFADDNPFSIVAISPTNVWLRGHETVHHWDGVAWKVSDAGTSMFGSNLSWDGKQLWTVVMRGLIRHP